MEITAFQKECMATCLSVLREKGFGECQFHEAAGKDERYFVANFSFGGRRFEIYVYEDEAGLFVGKEWFICEKPDYRSPQELIQAFSRMLLEKLPPWATK